MSAGQGQGSYTETGVCRECRDHGGRHFYYCSQTKPQSS